MSDRARNPWRAGLAVLVALAGLIAAPTLGAGAEAQGDVQVKAAFLAKFGDFVDWPAGAFADPAAPAVLCVLGQDPFGATLDRAVEGQKIHGRVIVLRRVDLIDKTSGCHLAYIGGGSQDPALALRLLAYAPVLTITDQAPEDARGVIDFTPRDRRVRFQIDDKDAARHGLTVSSKLLALALSVRPR